MIQDKERADGVTVECVAALIAGRLVRRGCAEYSVLSFAFSSGIAQWQVCLRAYGKKTLNGSQF